MPQSNTVLELYELMAARQCEYFCGWIEFLVEKKGVVHWMDDSHQLDHYAANYGELMKPHVHKFMIQKQQQYRVV